jgi:hypothetical protein
MVLIHNTNLPHIYHFIITLFEVIFSLFVVFDYIRMKYQQE